MTDADEALPDRAGEPAARPDAGVDEALAGLRRWPDVEAENLHAVDAADRLMLDEAAPLLAGAEVAVIGDAYGALTLGALLRGAARARVHQDPRSAELALAANASRLGLADRYRAHALDADLVRGARLVLLRLPRSLEALDELAAVVAAGADDDTVIIAGGMLKHMSPAMNDVLAGHFERVEPSLARQKARLLRVRAPRTGVAVAAWPKRARDDDLGLWVCAHGAAFAGTRVDIGTRFLLETLDRHPELLAATPRAAQVADSALPSADDVIDLGCGTGVIATWVALRGIPVLATDQSAAAVASATATAAANGVADRVRVVRDDALSSQADGSARLVLLNPPFHIGASVHAGIAVKLFTDAARVLAPGGSLIAVWNSHLAYRGALTRIVGPTRQLARNAKFTVTVSTRR